MLVIITGKKHNDRYARAEEFRDDGKGSPQQGTLTTVSLTSWT